MARWMLGALLLALALPSSRAELGQPPPPEHCALLTNELLEAVAVKKTVLVTVVDMIMLEFFGESWKQSVEMAGVTNYLMAALDPPASVYLGRIGVPPHCFNVPPWAVHKPVQGYDYKWGSQHWSQTTWNKVQVVKLLVDMGYSVIHVDLDATVFKDPTDYFAVQHPGPDIITGTDSLMTANKAGDDGLEANFSPYGNLNTGVYFVRNSPGGKKVMAAWVEMQKILDNGHDQDGYNTLVRGVHARGDKRFPPPLQLPEKPRSLFILNNTVEVAQLSIAMFGHTYSYVISRWHQYVGLPVYMVHWVWGAPNREAKRQCMRDALHFHDPPAYYEEPNLLTIEMELPHVPKGFQQYNETEDMVQYHVKAANFQLNQLYFGFALALALNRTLVLPKMLCFCAKNWYMTDHCRILGDHFTTLPFTCSLSQLLRTKKTVSGIKVHDKVINVREYSFLANPKVPLAIKISRIAVVTNPLATPGSCAPSILSNNPLDTPTVRAAVEASGAVLGTCHLPPAQTDTQIIEQLSQLSNYRVLHFMQPKQLVKGFANPDEQSEFDKQMSAHTTYWCCRSPADQQKMNLTDKIQLQMKP